MKTPNLKDINKANGAFMVVGRLVPEYKDNNWTFTEHLYDEPYMKVYPNDKDNFTEYIDNDDRIVYFFIRGTNVWAR